VEDPSAHAHRVTAIRRGKDRTRCTAVRAQVGIRTVVTGTDSVIWDGERASAPYAFVYPIELVAQWLATRA
jgi:hypothetical protein